MKTTSLIHPQVITGTLCAGMLLCLTAGASAQNLFASIGSSANGQIFEYSPSGVPTLIASGQDYPQGIAFNYAGDLFIANTALNAGESGNITKISRAGVQSTFASGIDPSDLAFNNAGFLFQSDYQSGNIYKYTTAGMQSTFATGLANPLALTFDSSGNLFVGAGYGAGNGYIEEITPGGAKSTFATGLTFPTGLAFNGAGDLFACNQSAGIIYEYTPAGVRSTFATLSQTDLDGLAFDSSGNLFVTGGNSGDLIEISPSGTPSIFASGKPFVVGVAFQPVPEPSTLALLAVGASAVAFRLRRKAS